MKESKTRILLVDDHAVFRESVALALAAEGDFQVNHCGSLSEAIGTVQQTPIDVVLLDHDLGTERSWQFFPAADDAGFRGRVLIITAWISEGEARRLIRHGAAGIFRKESPLSKLAESIRTVAEGGMWLDQHYAQVAGDIAGERPAVRSGSYMQLSEKERKVLRYVLEGLSNKEIAGRLLFSESYIKAILQRLFQGTGVRTRGQLVRIVLEHYDGQI